MAEIYSDKPTGYHPNNHSEFPTTEVLIKENQYEKLVFCLHNISFIQKIDRHVHLYKSCGKSVNTLIRTIKEIRKRIENQSLSHHFYFNSKLILNFEFLQQLITPDLSDKEALHLLKAKNLIIGLTELRNIRKLLRTKESVATCQKCTKSVATCQKRPLPIV